jgi:microcystin-dependent protein
MSDPFLGEITIFASNFAPRGWAFCDGQILNISQYQALFSLFGTTYGGDGRTTFALPDLRGRNAVHPGNGPGLSPYSWGQRGGAETVTLNITQIPSHTHQASVSMNRATERKPAGQALARAESRIYSSPPAAASMAGSTLTNTGGGQNHNNMMPYNTLNYIVALQGLFPSRN